MSASLDEPTIPAWLRRPLAAVWISLGLHAALLALVQVAPPASTGSADPVIEARLVAKHADAPAETVTPAAPEAAAPQTPPAEAPLLAPSEAVEATPVAAPPADPAPSLPAEPPAGPPAASEPAPAQPAFAEPPPAAVLTASVDLTYYTARELDRQPRALREIVPQYPAEADRQRLSGKVRLLLKLEVDGRVSDIELVDATPPDLFEDSAIRAFREARFAPAIKNGRPVRALMQVEVEYVWDGQR